MGRNSPASPSKASRRNPSALWSSPQARRSICAECSMDICCRARILAAILASAAPVGAFAQMSLAVEGTEFVLTIGDGRTLRSSDLVGATLMLGAGAGQTAVTIESVEEDAHA